VYHTTFSKEDLEKMLAMEADRFQNLEYSEGVFRTEALAVLGEYNKNASSPTRKLSEVLRDTAFDKHTYKHTTMGFLPDVKDMPNQFNYSKEFFSRYYRPEYTTVLVVGDVQTEQVRKMAAKYWGGWKRGDYKAAVPAEPPQQGPRTNHVKWPEKTLPWVSIGYKGPAYSDTSKDYATLDIIGYLAFSESSDLYQKLVIQEQKVDSLFGGIFASADPNLFTITARVKDGKYVDYVRDQVLKTLAALNTPVPAEKLERVKKNLRYSFALGLDSSDSIASSLAYYIALARTPETINKLYDVYESITPADIQRAAKTYFTEQGRTIVTLAGGDSK
jgi:zinc protease